MGNKLKNLIKESNLTQEQKEVWYTFLKVIPKKEKTAILEVIEGNPDHLEFLTENLLDKIEGFSKGDDSILNEALRKEKDYLKKDSI